MTADKRKFLFVSIDALISDLNDSNKKALTTRK